MSLSDAGLAMMIAEISPGAGIERVRPVGGGLAAATYAVKSTVGEVIVKVYRPGNEGARREWDGLTFAQRVDFPVPKPLALDVDGRWFGGPSLAMSRMPGRADVEPRDLDGWLRQIAQALAELGG